MAVVPNDAISNIQFDAFNHHLPILEEAEPRRPLVTVIHDDKGGRVVVAQVVNNLAGFHAATSDAALIRAAISPTDFSIMLAVSSMTSALTFPSSAS